MLYDPGHSPLANICAQKSTVLWNMMSDSLVNIYQCLKKPDNFNFITEELDVWEEMSVIKESGPFKLED
jgi:hypothetical protein